MFVTALCQKYLYQLILMFFPEKLLTSKEKSIKFIKTVVFWRQEKIAYHLV